MRRTAAGRKVDTAIPTEQEPAMSTDFTPDGTTPETALAPVPPRHRGHHRGRTTVVLSGVVAAAVAAAVGIGQLDKPAAKTQNASTSASDGSSSVSSPSTTS